MTIEEIVAREEQIRSLVDSATEEEIDALAKEAEELKEMRTALIKEAEERKAELEAIANEIIPETEIIERKIEEKEMEERTFGIESVEYRNAWLKSLQGVKLNEVEERAYASTDSHTAIPTLVADKMFEAMKKTAPMISEITLLRVAGAVKFIAQGTRNAASKHTENQSVNAAADTIVSVELGSKEFMKVIGISKAASTQSVDAFEGWLVQLLAGDIANAIDDYILNDATNGISAITYTANTNKIVATTYTYASFTSLVALLPASYDKGAKFVMNKATLWGKVANIVNSNGNPIFVADTNEGFAGKILGYPVLVDDYVATANNDIYLGDYSTVVGNIGEGVAVERDESSGFLSGTINYRGYAQFDSKPAVTAAIVKLANA